MNNTTNMNNTTIVSAFISNVNKREDLDVSKYYNNGKILLKSVVPKIIFLDEIMFNLIGEDYDKTNTLLVKINKEDIYLYEYKELIEVNVITNNANKDTLDYIFVMCNKTEWLKQAILLNNFNTSNFVWIDFGIRYIFKCTDEEFVLKLNNLQNKKYDKIRVGKIYNLNIDLNEHFYECIYKNIMWFFAGGVIGGDKEIILLLAEKMKDKCIEIITKKQTLMWEVNIWYLIYIDNKELFDAYFCNHDNTILDNY